MIIDIGAHVGTFAIPFEQFVGKHGKVWAIEVHPENYHLLAQNIAHNQCELSTFAINTAVSDSEKAYEIVEGTMNSGTHSCRPSKDLKPSDLTSLIVDE